MGGAHGPSAMLVTVAAAALFGQLLVSVAGEAGTSHGVKHFESLTPQDALEAAAKAYMSAVDNAFDFLPASKKETKALRAQISILTQQVAVLSGTAGPTGSPGTPGAGLTGPSGPEGDAGATGPKGDAGGTGPMGDAGGTGAMGDAGGTGAMGGDGPTGPTGPTGNTGISGTKLYARIPGDLGLNANTLTSTPVDTITACVLLCDANPTCDYAKFTDIFGIGALCTELDITDSAPYVAAGVVNSQVTNFVSVPPASSDLVTVTGLVFFGNPVSFATASQTRAQCQGLCVTRSFCTFATLININAQSLGTCQLFSGDANIQSAGNAEGYFKGTYVS